MVLAAHRRREQDAGNLLTAHLQAETDALTGLYNRRAWQRVLDQEEARFQRFADPTVAVVLDLGLDRLKTVNDTEGHDAGDRNICAAADALLDAVRDTDIAARLGGDELGVLMTGCTVEQANQTVGRIYESFESAGVAGSVGLGPDHGDEGLPGGAGRGGRRDVRRQGGPTDLAQRHRGRPWRLTHHGASQESAAARAHGQRPVEPTSSRPPPPPPHWAHHGCKRRWVTWLSTR